MGWEGNFEFNFSVEIWMKYILGTFHVLPNLLPLGNHEYYQHLVDIKQRIVYFVPAIKVTCKKYSLIQQQSK